MQASVAGTRETSDGFSNSRTSTSVTSLENQLLGIDVKMRFTRIGSQRERRRKRTLRPRTQEYELDYMKLSRLSTRGGWGFPNLKSNSCELLPTFNNHQPTVIVTAGQRRTPVATDGQRARVVLRRRNRSDGCGGRRDICISDTNTVTPAHLSLHSRTNSHTSTSVTSLENQQSHQHICH